MSDERLSVDRREHILIIGAQKSGTSALYQGLVAHPEIRRGSEKELNFFIEEGTWSRGQAWYFNQFASGGRYTCDASPSYTSAPYLGGAPSRANQVVPDARLIYVVRDPVDRLLAHYLHAISHHHEVRSFEEVVADLHLERDDIDHGRTSQFAAPVSDRRLARERYQGYLARSMYRYQLDQWLEFFDRDQILVVRQHDLKHGDTEALKRVGNFVGIELRGSLPQYHVTAEKRVTNAFGEWLRQSGLGQRARRTRLRSTLRKLGKGVFYQRLPEASLSAQMRDYVRSLIADDVTAFEEEFGPVGGTNAPAVTR